MNFPKWLRYALGATLLGGVWGALIEIPEKSGFPSTLGYIVWAFTMLIPATVAMKKAKWKLEYDKRSIIFGLIIGLFGAGGQMLLFVALESGPAYMVFPLISLAPVVTILASFFILKERTNKIGWIGIIIAIIAIPVLSYQDSTAEGEGYAWLILSFLVFVFWGAQGFFMRYANQTMSAASIFFYMTLSALLLIPCALYLTDFSGEINYGFDGPYLAFLIHILNAVNALFIVNAYRYGKAIVVSPITNAAPPIVTIVLSLIIYQVMPNVVIVVGMVLAVISTLLLSFAEESDDVENIETKEE